MKRYSLGDGGQIHRHQDPRLGQLINGLREWRLGIGHWAHSNTCCCLKRQVAHKTMAMETACAAYTVQGLVGRSQVIGRTLHLAA